MACCLLAFGLKMRSAPATVPAVAYSQASTTGGECKAQRRWSPSSGHMACAFSVGICDTGPLGRPCVLAWGCRRCKRRLNAIARPTFAAVAYSSWAYGLLMAGPSPPPTTQPEGMARILARPDNLAAVLVVGSEFETRTAPPKCGAFGLLNLAGAAISQRLCFLLPGDQPGCW